MTDEDRRRETLDSIEQILSKCITVNLPMLVRLFAIANNSGHPLNAQMTRIRKKSGKLSFTMEGTRQALIMLGWKGTPSLKSVMDYSRCLEALTLVSRINKGE